MKRLLVLGMIFLTCNVYASPDNSINVPNSFTANTIIQSAKTNDNNNEISGKYNVHTHNDITQVGSLTIGSWLATAIGLQYGGTGANLSGSSSGSIVFITNGGVMSALPLGAAGQMLTVNPAATSVQWNSANIEHIVARGFEASASTLTAEVTVYPGTLYHSSTIISTSNSVVLNIGTALDYSSGSIVTYAGGAGWNYIGVNSVGQIKFLGKISPQFDDVAGHNVMGAVKLYSLEGGSYWRIIGATRVSTTNVSADGFFQDGNCIYWDVPINVTTALSTGAWSAAIDCSAAMPTISKRAIFGYQNADTNLSVHGGFIRPNGSIYATGVADGISWTYTNGGSLGGRMESFTDSSQRIQHYDSGNNAVTIDLIGFYLRCR